LGRPWPANRLKHHKGGGGGGRGGGGDTEKDEDGEGRGEGGELIEFPCKSKHVTLIRNKNQ
jgi:hypothetical protein